MMASMRALGPVFLCLLLAAIAPSAALAQKPDFGNPQPRFETDPYEQVRERNERRDQRESERPPVRGYPQPVPDLGPAQERQPAPVFTAQTVPERRDVSGSDIDVERILPFLAYTLGELHYLAFACDGTDQQVWRDQMIQLLALEAESDGRRRDRLIENFNDGYRVQQRYRPICGAQVDAERRALAHRGRDLAEMMRSAYFD